MDEQAVGDAAQLAELFVTNTPPWLGQWLATDEAVCRLGHTLHPPLSRLVWVHDVEDQLVVGDGQVCFEVK